MEAEARYTYVGAAMLVLLAGLAAGLFWLLGVRGGENQSLYAIHFERQALDGLEVGAQVNLRGIKVGRVEDYALSDAKLNRVRVVVRVDRRAPVRTDTVAVITRNIVTGIASITLVNRDPGAPALTQAGPDDPLPVIGEGRSDLDEFAGRVHQMGEQASNALANLNLLLTADNRRDLMEAVRGLRDLMTGITQRLATLDRTLARGSEAAGAITRAAGTIAQSAGRLAQAGDDAASAVARTGRQLGEAGDRLAVVGERAGTRLDAALAGTEQMVAETRGALSRVTAAIDRVEQQAGRTARQIEERAASVDDQMGAAVAELRLAVESAARALDALHEPRAALLGPGRAQLGPGEELP